MLKSTKNVFWEALIVTVAIFVIGLFLGMMIESSNSNKINQMYMLSEINLVDGMAISMLSENSAINCEALKNSNLVFADRIYKEAKLLEKYEMSGELTDNMKYLHKKYDLLRTLLWMSNRESLKRCKNYNLVVYLYKYETKDIQKKALQNVWSKILLKLKMTDNNVLLIPIAVDQNITSLNLLIKDYNVTNFPAVIVNNKKVLYNIDNADSVKRNF